MKKTLKTIIASILVSAMMLGTGLTACAAPKAAVSATIPVKESYGAPTGITPGGVWIYGVYTYNELPYIYGTTPAEYLLAIDAAGITNEMSDYEKCVRINNYLCAIGTYGEGYSAAMHADTERNRPYIKSIFIPTGDGGFSINAAGLAKLASLTEVEKPLYGDPQCQYGYYLLTTGQGVCESYADAFQTMASALGIDCTVQSSPQMNHAWNKVVINGVVYYVDVTWNDPSGNAYLLSPVLWADHAMPDIIENKSVATWWY